MTILSILLTILLLGILIVIHELGHFWAARLMKIEVREFGVGFGPKLCSWNSRKHETRFVIRAIPLGGYNAFWEDLADGEIDPDDPRLYRKQNVWKRMFVVIMGPVMNFVLAFVLATAYFWGFGIGNVTGVDPYIATVNAAGPAWDAGLQAGDIITEINGRDMLDGTMDTLMNALAGYREGDEPLRVTVKRGDETLETEMTPAWNPDEERMMVGVTIGGTYRIETEKTTLIGAAAASAETCWRASGMILEALKKLVTTREGIEQVTGPVGIVSIVSSEVRNGGFQAFLDLLISISINLGLINLLPIPGLDGSKLILGIIEVIRGKPVPPEKEAIVNLIGMVLLLGLLALVTFQDIRRLIR